MIESFRHKGLEKFFETGSTAGLNAAMAKRLSVRLQVIEDAARIEDADLPGYRLHELKGERAGTWSIAVTGNWRLTFRFEEGHAYDVDLEDYH